MHIQHYKAKLISIRWLKASFQHGKTCILVGKSNYESLKWVIQHQRFYVSTGTGARQICDASDIEFLVCSDQHSPISKLSIYAGKCVLV
jgi:hypothetical protein